jgi:hypothetical protein
MVKSFSISDTTMTKIDYLKKHHGISQAQAIREAIDDFYLKILPTSEVVQKRFDEMDKAGQVDSTSF